MALPAAEGDSTRGWRSDGTSVRFVHGNLFGTSPVCGIDIDLKSVTELGVPGNPLHRPRVSECATATLEGKRYDECANDDKIPLARYGARAKFAPGEDRFPVSIFVQGEVPSGAKIPDDFQLDAKPINMSLLGGCGMLGGGLLKAQSGVAPAERVLPTHPLAVMVHEFGGAAANASRGTVTRDLAKIGMRVKSAFKPCSKNLWRQPLTVKHRATNDRYNVARLMRYIGEFLRHYKAFDADMMKELRAQVNALVLARSAAAAPADTRLRSMLWDQRLREWKVAYARDVLGDESLSPNRLFGTSRNPPPALARSSRRTLTELPPLVKFCAEHAAATVHGATTVSLHRALFGKLFIEDVRTIQASAIKYIARNEGETSAEYTRRTQFAAAMALRMTIYYQLHALYQKFALEHGLVFTRKAPAAGEPPEIWMMPGAPGSYHNPFASWLFEYAADLRREGTPEARRDLDAVEDVHEFIASSREFGWRTIFTCGWTAARIEGWAHETLPALRERTSHEMESLTKTMGTPSVRAFLDRYRAHESEAGAAITPLGVLNAGGRSIFCAAPSSNGLDASSHGLALPDERFRTADIHAVYHPFVSASAPILRSEWGLSATIVAMLRVSSASLLCGIDPASLRDAPTEPSCVLIPWVIRKRNYTVHVEAGKGKHPAGVGEAPTVIPVAKRRKVAQNPYDEFIRSGHPDMFKVMHSGLEALPSILTIINRAK
jgi:hypothetical protein